MSFSSRKEHLAAIYQRYHRTTIRKEKKQVLNEFCAASGYHRKYAIRILNAPFSRTPKLRKKRKPRCRYTNEDVYFLKKLWMILDYPCGQRLKPMIPVMTEALERFRELMIPAHVKAHLAKVSAKTIDRKLVRYRRETRRRIRGTTKPGSLLKKHIPMVLSRWDETRPGFVELDLVAHCGMSANGDFVSTLNLTDLATGWTEEEAFLGKAQERVQKALETIRSRLPFPLRGIDPDNGSEFINWQLYRYCLSRKIEFTRGRPTKKNDNAHIEQKNWTHVRKIVGYGRFETQEAVDLLNTLYRRLVRYYMNFFQPVMKLMKKERRGGQLIRRYDVPRTPYQRVMESPSLSLKVKSGLREIYQTLNPAALRREIEQGIARLYKMKKGRTTKLKNQDNHD